MNRQQDVAATTEALRAVLAEIVDDESEQGPLRLVIAQGLRDLEWSTQPVASPPRRQSARSVRTNDPSLVRRAIDVDHGLYLQFGSPSRLHECA